jgi:hypothetical protein
MRTGFRQAENRNRRSSALALRGAASELAGGESETDIRKKSAGRRMAS